VLRYLGPSLRQLKLDNYHSLERTQEMVREMRPEVAKNVTHFIVGSFRSFEALAIICTHFPGLRNVHLECINPMPFRDIPSRKPTKLDRGVLQNLATLRQLQTITFTNIQIDADLFNSSESIINLKSVRIFRLHNLYFGDDIADETLSFQLEPFCKTMALYFPNLNELAVESKGSRLKQLNGDDIENNSKLFSKLQKCRFL